MTSTPESLSPSLVQWLTGQHRAVLVTLRRDGTPQTSNVVFWFDGAVARISVTDDRAKTRNLRRDGRAVLHVLGDTFYQYASVSAAASLSEVSTEPGDAVGRELLDLHDAVAGPHPDPDEFYAAMVTDRRLVARLTPTSAVSIGIDNG